MRLQGRVALVTGAQQGIGRSIALAFAHQGANLVVNYLDDEAAAETLVAAIEDDGIRARAVQGSVTDTAAIAVMVATGDDLGGIDILVNNAGIFPRSDFLDLAEAEWDRGARRQPQGRLPLRPGSGPRHGRPGPRRGYRQHCLGHRHHRFGARRPLHGEQGGARGLYPGNGSGSGAPWHPGQRHRARRRRYGSAP